MSSNVLFALLWILAGMVIMGLIVWFAMPSLMMVRRKSKLNYNEAIRTFSEAILKKQGWNVLAENDYKKKTEAFVNLEPTGSLNICNPRHASAILADAKNRFVTAIMPLAIGFHENKKGHVYISMLNIGLLGKMFGGTISKVMGSAGKEINEAIASVSS